MHALGDWECPNRVDCILHDRCWIKARTGAEACAPYPGPPNHKLPAIKYTVDWFVTWYMWRVLIYHSIDEFTLVQDYYMHRVRREHCEDTRMQAMHSGRLHVRSSDEME